MTIPLFVIGGFLGAGKTTLLNRWLSEGSAGRMAVLVNDFGAINVDAALIGATSGDTIALTNGCVCCSIGDDLTAALIKVMDAQPPYDAIVVEASGVSDPWRIAQIALADPELELAGVIVLVDAATIAEQAGDALLADTLARQGAAADLIVLNKIDLASADQHQAAREWVQAHAPSAAQLETTQAQVHVQELRAVAAGGHPDRGLDHCLDHGLGHGPDHHAHHDHVDASLHADHQSQFESVAWRPTSVMSAEALRRRLSALPAGVLRLKGLLPCDDGHWREVQYAGRHLTMRRVASPPSEGPVLVAIGLRGQWPIAAVRSMV